MKLDADRRNLASLTETDSVLTTYQAIEYLNISKPTFLKYIRLGTGLLRDSAQRRDVTNFEPQFHMRTEKKVKHESGGDIHEMVTGDYPSRLRIAFPELLC